MLFSIFFCFQLCIQLKKYLNLQKDCKHFRLHLNAVLATNNYFHNKFKLILHRVLDNNIRKVQYKKKENNYEIYYTSNICQI